MCGIFASLSLAGPIRDDYSENLSMLAHRGPDDSGVSLVSLTNDVRGGRYDRAWLGHRRLSILDTNPRGAQPMTLENDRFVIVYNGEIFNYVELRRECSAAGLSFSTTTDTEVLLACWSLWGEKVLEKLTGMFAFILVDKLAGCAWLARDHFGIKPLHYSFADDQLIISSEIGPMMASGKIDFEMDSAQSFEFIRFGASASVEETLISGVSRFPPASVAKFDFASGELSPPRRFWSPSRRQVDISFSDAVAECRERFLHNIRLHLRSDVPVGAALSGGLDSSAIVCAVNHLEPDLQLNTFSFISADPAQSEEKWVDIVNAHINAKPHKVKPMPDDLTGDLERLVAAQGEPFGSSSIYAQLRVFQMAREAEVPVTLDGQGADELLGGYWPYLGTVGAQWLRAGKLESLRRLIWNGGHDAKIRATLSANVAQACMPPAWRSRFRKMIGRGLFPDFLDKAWFDREDTGWRSVADQMIKGYDSLQAHLIDTVERTSLPTLLRIADRSSMAYSVESRVPFLTPDFADFLLELPPEYIVSRDGERKYVFREAMRGILPESVRARRDKIGFFADDALWLRQNAAQFRKYYDEIADMPQFDTDRTMVFLNQFFAGENHSAQQVWRIFMIAIWRSQMRTLSNG